MERTNESDKLYRSLESPALNGLNAIVKHHAVVVDAATQFVHDMDDREKRDKLVEAVVHLDRLRGELLYELYAAEQRREG